MKNLRIAFDSNILIGTKSIAALVKRFPRAAAAAGDRAANEVANAVMNTAAKEITQRYQLPASYVKKQFTLTEAKNGKSEAVISARKRGVRLATFGAQQLTVAAPRAKGDPRRGIARGRKQAGVSVHVLRSSGRIGMRSRFLLPLRAGKEAAGNGWGVFWRLGKKIEHEYGPAPFQMFRWWAKRGTQRIKGQLVESFSNHFKREMARGR